MTVTPGRRYDHGVPAPTRKTSPAVPGERADGPDSGEPGLTYPRPANESRVERRRARVRSVIADAALRMFISRGYEATTVEDVADAVDMSPRTVFRYFPYKEDMLREAVHLEMTELIAAVEARPAGEHAADALGRAMATTWSRADRDPELIRSLLRMIATVPRARGALIETSSATRDAMAQALAPRLGRPVTDLSTQVATACALSALNVVMDTWAAMPPGTDLIPLLEEAMATIKAGPLGSRP